MASPVTNPPMTPEEEEAYRKYLEDREKDGSTPPGSPNLGGRRNRRTRKSVRILIKHEGDLSKLGYSMGKSVRSRHASLKKAVKRYGRLATSRKLGALAVFNKRRHPGTARKARSDRKFVMKE